MRKVALFLIAALAAGCSKNNPNVSVSAGGSAVVNGNNGANGKITIDSVKLVIQSVELERDLSPGKPGDPAADEDLEMGPFVIELTAAQLEKGTLTAVFDSQVPAGTYKEIEFEIHKITAEDVKAHPEFEPMLNKSIEVKGTGANGPFTFVTSIDEEQEKEGSFVVGGGEGNNTSNNITLHIDTTQWFAGTNMDPSVQGFDQAAIEKAIKASIDLYDDDNKDGVKD